MALVDDVRIKVKAGAGGDGSNVFRTALDSSKKFTDGGDGGHGGNIYFQASSNVSDLSRFRYEKEVKAQDGGRGMNKNCTGKSGKDKFVLAPPGTKIYDMKTGEHIEILDLNIPVLIARGGRGGEGSHNYKPDIHHFRPQYKEGEQGEEKDLHLVLSLIADVGLIGLPNAGKSSLLNVLTNANPKIGDYPFTTLEPNLGVMGKTIISDIPGLIEGASKGVGLGIQFLKHIEKTKILMHCIDSQTQDPIKVYETVIKEFSQYNLSLLEKEEVILLTKTDLISPEELKLKIKQLKKFKRKIVPVSVYDNKSIDGIKAIIESLLNNFQDQKPIDVL